MTGALDEAHAAAWPASMRAENSAGPATPYRVATRHHAKAAVRQYATIGRRRFLPCSADYLIASFFPGAAAFLTSLSSRTPFSNLASHADSSSSTGSEKLR